MQKIIQDPEKNDEAFLTVRDVLTITDPLKSDYNDSIKNDLDTKPLISYLIPMCYISSLK